MHHLGPSNLEQVGIEKAQSCHDQLVAHLNGVGDGHLPRRVHGELLLLGTAYVLVKGQEKLVRNLVKR